MLNKKKNVFLILLAFGLIWIVIALMQVVEIYFGQNHIDMLFPKGIIAQKQRNLLFIAQGLMLLIVLPVFALTFIFVWKYRVSNRKAMYKPEMDANHLIELIWWVVPFLIIIAIGIYTWRDTFLLDPFREIQNGKKPVRIQVVALQWNWLFIYPEQKIASLNFFQFPEKTPVNFEITSDAPMNSFWIPQLGGQIYAMPKMTTRLSLMADEIGEYNGSSANISGEGFAGMRFIAKASSEKDFEEWIQTSQQTTNRLGLEEYTELAKPSANYPVKTFRLEKEELFDWILMKYMMPMPEKEVQSSYQLDRSAQQNNEIEDLLCLEN